MTQIPDTPTSDQPPPVELLILGAGWTSTFLIPLLNSCKISYAATQRSPPPSSPNCIAFTFDPESDDATPFTALPKANTVLITFPIKVEGGSRRLVELYRQTHQAERALFVQLGSTGIWDVRLLSPSVRTSVENISHIGWSDPHIHAFRLERSPLVVRYFQRTRQGGGRASRPLLALYPYDQPQPLRLVGRPP
jgi:hypothetical protein